MRISRASLGLEAKLLVLVLAWSACGSEAGPPLPPLVSASTGQDPELTQVLEAAREAILKRPEELALRIELAMILDANALDHSAQLAWQQVTELDASDPRPWYFLSRVSERNGDLETCFEAIQRCIQIEPNYAASQARLGRLLMERGELQLAETAFQRSNDLDPSSPRGVLGLARLLLARDAASETLALLRPVLARNPREPYVNALLARAHVILGDRTEATRCLAAEEQAGEASGSDPWASEVRQRATGKLTRIARAKSLLASGDAQAALVQVEQLWNRQFGEQSVLETLCEIRLALGEPKLVLELLQEAKASFAESYSLELYRARAEWALGADERALAAAQAAAGLNPHRPEAPALSGQLLFGLERASEAVPELETARKNGDTSLQTLVFLGRARGGAGDLPGGLMDLEQATLENPTIPKPWAYRAELLALSARHGEAQESLDKATRLGLDAELRASLGKRLTELSGQKQ